MIAIRKNTVWGNTWDILRVSKRACEYMHALRTSVSQFIMSCQKSVHNVIILYT